MLSFALALALGLDNSYWAVITAIIVVQSSVGGSLKATVDRFVGTVGGSVWGVAVALALPHQGPLPLGIALLVTLAPLAVLASFRPAYRVAPITAMILLLVPLHEAGGLLYSGIDRILEIGLGGVVAMLVTIFVLPSRAHSQVAASAAHALEAMAELTAVVTGNLAESLDTRRVQDLHDAIRLSISRAEIAAEEAGRERRSHLTDAPDAEPLCRTLRRLRNDLAAVGRATAAPFATEMAGTLASPAAEAGEAAAQRLRAIATALEGGSVTGSPDGAARTIARYEAAIAELRRQGLLRSLSSDAISQVFGLSFALDQLQRDLVDLGDRANEWIAARPAARQ